jgi:hypothetical protein
VKRVERELKVDGFKAYKYYMAIKLHFTTLKYNVFENRGHVKGTRDTFNSRNDRYIFEKLAQKYPDDREIIQFFVSNFAYGQETAIYANGEADDLYSEWKRRKQSITKIFIDDLATIMNFCDIHKFNKESIFKNVDGDLPVLTNLYLSGKISIETLRIIDDIYPFVDDWHDDSTIKIVMGDGLLRIKKLKGFVKYDLEKATKIFNHFKEELSF